ncbi:MAG: preprotein translocase subunit YajC [Oscillospiraceae bacterium]|nr:preprotein translocase subunit YajC [Oscillospiraceae bacterium]
MTNMGETILMIVVMIFIFYYFLIRPENKKKKETEQMRSSMKAGDRVTTIGGVTGTVCHLDDTNVVIETGADRVRIEFAKWAISTNDTAVEAKKIADAQNGGTKKRGLFGK